MSVGERSLFSSTPMSINSPFKRPDSQRTRKMAHRVLMASQAALLVALAASSIPSTAAVAVKVREQGGLLSGTLSPTLLLRHGDEEHGEESVHGNMHVDAPIHAIHSPASSAATQGMPNAHMHTDPSAGEHMVDEQEAMHSQAHAHGHGNGHGHSHNGPHPYDGVPDPSKAGDVMLAVPELPVGSGGHSHGHGGEAAQLELNETTILRGKGPESLSYIEWDFAYGLGKAAELQRFTAAYTDANETWSNLMGVSGGRYRALVDEKDSEERKMVIQDIQGRLQADANYPGRHRYLMVLHVVGCILSCFLLLPASLALRAANSSISPLLSLVYLATLAGSLFTSMLYKAMTPRLYPSNAHSNIGYAVFWLSVLCLGGDVFRLVKQILATLHSMRGAKATKGRLRSLFHTAIGRSSSTFSAVDQYDALEEERMLSGDENGSGVSDARELDLDRIHKPQRTNSNHSSGSHSPPRSVHFEEDDGHQRHDGRTSRSWSRDLPSPTNTLLNTPRTSVLGELPGSPWKLSSEGLRAASWKRFDDHHEEQADLNRSLQQPKRFRLARSILRYGHVTVARGIVPVSFAAAYTGLAVYTGSCRASYKNTCLAHGIKGGIFFWYGLLTFGRYLGAYADLGWAWNRRPSSKSGGKKDGGVSAEWVECLVIFIYGATNTWMERFGAAPGDPYSVKEVQHISIAVMFWFAGLMGLILETKSLKALLALPVALKQASLNESSHSSRRSDHDSSTGSSSEDLIAGQAKPPSYSFSFNPFPALVIGVTGVAMAAHHQDYVYEVSIHSLWGNLLAGFSVLRILTYFFLWLRPPTSSVLPSRPPTEALASFSLACGGLVFMLSSEEVSFVAMRNGFGDFMMILNVTVAVVSLLFCEVAGLMVLKAWAVKREHVRAKRLRLSSRDDDDGDEENEEERGLHAHSHHQTDFEANRPNTFIIGHDDDEEREREREREQDEKRHQLSSSPEQA